MKALDIAAVFTSAPLTSLYFAAIFSIFSTIGHGKLEMITATILAVFFLFVLPTVPILYSFRKKLTDFNVSNIKFRQKIYYPAIASYLLGSLVFIYFGDKMLFSILFCYATVTTSLMLIN